MFRILILLLICSSNVLSQNYDFNVRCQGKEMDGSLTLEANGKGRNKIDATEQAKKEAVRAVIFKGIKEGNGGCTSDPLIFDPNIEMKYEEYFANFFKDGGEYLKYVSLKDEQFSNKIKRKKLKSDEIQQRMVVVRVLRIELKQKLKQDNIK